MRINLNFLDNFLDNPELHECCDYQAVADRKFEGGRVVLDNHQFAHCSFSRCTLLYSGGPCALVDCEVDYQSGLTLTGPAARGHVLWKLFDRMPGRHLPTDSGE